ncbi:MAG: hypothetical protein ACRER2_16520 [Methylococcales bacterium]
MQPSTKISIFAGVLPFLLAGPAAPAYAHGGDASQVHGCVGKLTK